MKQSEYDTQEVMAVIQDLLTQEIDTTHEISSSLVTVGESNVEMTKTAQQVHQIVTDNTEQIKQAIADQQEVISQLNDVAAQLERTQLDEKAVARLRSAFDLHLAKVLDGQAHDKEQIMECVHKGYEKYIQRVNDLVDQMKQLSQQLEATDYAAQIENCHTAITDLNTTISANQDERKETSKKQMEQINHLIETLSTANATFDQLITATTRDQELARKTMARMAVIEDRVDTLIALSGQSSTSAENASAENVSAEKEGESDGE